MEKRNRQNLTLLESTEPSPSRGFAQHKQAALFPEHTRTNWKDRISFAAQREGIVFNNLLSHFNGETLREAYAALAPNKAVGIDGVSKEIYGKNLEANLRDLVNRLQNGSYKPQEKRKVLIPKASGGTRPIAISCLEDKLVEWVADKILQRVYEPIFIDNSFGFRPNKSAHGAITRSFQALNGNKHHSIVEIDLANCFNSIPHRKLMKILGKRVSDRRFKGLIGRFLRVGIFDPAGFSTDPESGTPQGSIMSPVLANVYLHEVLDAWFMDHYGSAHNTMVRYADDAVFFFSHEEEANAFRLNLEKRVQAFGLSLNPDKTRVIRFGRGEQSAFSFLNFTFYWNKIRPNGVRRLRIKTEKKALHTKIQAFYDWIKSVRSKFSTKEIWKLAKAKILGHYQYYGFWMNRPKLNHFYQQALKSIFKWLNRRSQIPSFSWEEFQRKLLFHPLPAPPPLHQLKPLGRNPYVIC